MLTLPWFYRFFCPITKDEKWSFPRLLNRLREVRMFFIFLIQLILWIFIFFKLKRSGHHQAFTVEQGFHGRGKISSFTKGSFMSFFLGSYHYLQKKAPITSQIFLLKICSLESNIAIFICLGWWFFVNDSNKQIFSFAFQKNNKTNQKPLTKIERILYWRHCYACGTGSNTWTASSVGAAGRGAAVAPCLEELQK